MFIYKKIDLKIFIFLIKLKKYIIKLLIYNKEKNILYLKKKKKK